MSSTQTIADELRKIITDYDKSYGAKCPDIERLKNLLSKVIADQGYKLLSSIGDNDGDTVLTNAALRGDAEMCNSALISTIS